MDYYTKMFINVTSMLSMKLDYKPHKNHSTSSIFTDKAVKSKYKLQIFKAFYRNEDILCNILGYDCCNYNGEM